MEISFYGRSAIVTGGSKGAPRSISRFYRKDRWRE